MKISILLAAYNGEKYIREQIESVLSQTYADWELIAHDDGSSDATPAILSEYASLYPEKIRIIDAPPTGSAKDNFFFLMNNTDGQYVMFCDQDDVWHADKLEKTIAEMQSIEEELSPETPILVFSELRVTDENMNTLCPTLSEYQHLDCSRTSFNKLLLQNVATGCTVMINRALLELARVENSKGIVMHDWWCALIASRFGVLSFISEPLADYRQHSENSVGALNAGSAEYMMKRLSKTDRIKSDLLATRVQSGRFAEQFEDDFALEYAKLGSSSRLSRLAFYGKNDMWKSGFMRNLTLFI